MVYERKNAGFPNSREKSTSGAGSTRRKWKAGILFAGTALFGGIAIAFWNRGALNSLRPADQDDGGLDAFPDPVVDRSRDADGIY